MPGLSQDGLAAVGIVARWRPRFRVDFVVSRSVGSERHGALVRRAGTAGDTPRDLTADQGQALVQSLIGGKPAMIAVTADPDGPEPGDYALAIATRLGMAGWQIQGSQISRTVPSGLQDIHGVVLVVRDEKKPPEMALQLKKAMASAKIFLPIISRPDMAADAAMLWIGKRPTLNAATQ